MFSYFEPNFIEKIPLGKWFFKFLAKIEMTRNTNRLFDRHFETVQRFIFFFSELLFFIVHTYMVKFHCKIPVGKWFFLRGYPSLGTNGSKSTLVT